MLKRATIASSSPSSSPSKKSQQPLLREPTYARYFQDDRQSPPAPKPERASPPTPLPRDVPVVAERKKNAPPTPLPRDTPPLAVSHATEPLSSFQVFPTPRMPAPSPPSFVVHANAPYVAIDSDPNDDDENNNDDNEHSNLNDEEKRQRRSGSENAGVSPLLIVLACLLLLLPVAVGVFFRVPIFAGLHNDVVSRFPHTFLDYCTSGVSPAGDDGFFACLPCPAGFACAEGRVACGSGETFDHSLGACAKNSNLHREAKSLADHFQNLIDTEAGMQCEGEYSISLHRIQSSWGLHQDAQKLDLALQYLLDAQARDFPDYVPGTHLRSRNPLKHFSCQFERLKQDMLENPLIPSTV